MNDLPEALVARAADPNYVPPKVAICFPYYKHWEGDMGSSAFLLAAHSAMRVAMAPITTSGAYVEDNRNGCVKLALALKIPFDWLMWIDTDMMFPANAMTRLIAHDLDIVGANYRARKPPYKSAGHYLDGTDNHLLEPGLQAMAHLPTGMLLTRFDIYRKMKYPWFKASNFQHVPRDDVYFCRKARALGYEIWCDQDLTKEVHHIGDQTISWFTKKDIKPIETIGGLINQNDGVAMAEANAAKAHANYEEWAARHAAE